MLEITSPQNPRIKSLAKLRQRKQRKATGLFLIDGKREILRALTCNHPLDSILVDLSFDQAPEIDQIMRLADQNHVSVINVHAEALKKVEFGDRSEGVVGVGKEIDLSLENFRPKESSVILVLEGIEKPGNLGAILRSADGSGVGGVIVCDPLTDFFNPATIRSSLGTVFNTPIASASTEETMDWLLRNGKKIYAAMCGESQFYTEVSYQGEVAIVLGTEADGLSDRWVHHSVQPIFIPMNGIADSLNVSVASAVICYEANRQRAQ